jgi:phosphoenolpyruvate carboxylase
MLILMREAGLWRRGADGAVTSDLDVCPLFETVADLEGSKPLLERLFASKAYAAHLRARGNFQEIMLGYSDSNKDGGYWMANWRLYKGQRDIARVCQSAGVKLRFFHGRGGSVARGGGRAQRAIRSSPPESQSGAIRFTEQGEVITFRYAMPDLARRHLEQIVGAVLASSAAKRTPPAIDETELEPLMDALSERTMRAYRDLIDRPRFWEWFVRCSPVRHIGDLQIASRPVSRSGGALRFDSLRAIPWVFSWTQMRFNAPGWYGIGSAFESLVLDDPGKLDLCRRAYRSGGSFRVFIDNAQQEMARARLAMARWYALGEADDLLEMLTTDFALARRAVLEITGQQELLDNNAVIQRSIIERNVDADALNVIQIELLRRNREAEDPLIQRLILLSVNGLAAAMQSTG